METDQRGAAGRAPRRPTAGNAAPGDAAPADAVPPDEAVTALYQVHAVGLIRLAVVMLGDRPAAEDVVQEAFAGLYRRWKHLDDPARALGYVRSATLNGCRSVLRTRIRSERRRPPPTFAGESVSAESTVLLGEEHREVLAALRGLPDRQREALVLKFYLDLSQAQIAASMGISQGTVKSTTSRALAALGRQLREDA
jgi:RNA polymerase sigma-70 factor (sigma-E family)